MSTIDRRKFLRNFGGAVMAPSLAGLMAACDDQRLPTVPSAPELGRIPRAQKGYGGYGELVVAPNCPEILIPVGFTCERLSQTRVPSRANPAFIVPQAFDGMAAFPMPNGNI